MNDDNSHSDLNELEAAPEMRKANESDSDATERILAELQALRSDVADLRQRLDSMLAAAGGGNVQQGHSASPRARLQRRIGAFLAGGARRDWEPPRPRLWDAIALLILTASGFLLRFVNLTTIPHGMHGDEAFATLLARRVMDGEKIGVFTGQAAGNPTGHVILLIPFIKVFDDPIFAARFISVVGGTIAIVAMYVLARRNAGFGSAVIATFLLVVSGWAIQFSRIGFVTGNWLPFALIAAIAMFEAIRRQHWAWWMLAGLLVVSPIYIYNGATPVVLMTIPVVVAATIGIPAALVACAAAGMWFSPSLVTGAVLVILVVLAALDPKLRKRTSWLNLAAFAVPAFLVARPMISFAREHHQDYFGRSKDLSVFRTDAWKDLDGLYAQGQFLLERYWLFYNRLTFDPRPDGVDMSGATAIVPEIMWWMILAGIAISLIRRPGWFTAYAAVVIVVVPFSAVLTDMVLRRSLIILPFGCLLAGIGFSEALTAAWKRSRLLGVVALIVSVILLGRVAWTSYDDFFNTTAHSPTVSHTFAVELRDTMEWVATLPDGYHLIFFSGRWVSDNEVGVLLVPDIRSFSENRLEKWAGTGTYEVDPTKGRPVFVLIGEDNLARLPEIQALYPGGEVITGPILPNMTLPAYVAYIVP